MCAMTSLATAEPSTPAVGLPAPVGPLGRLGRWTATHRRFVVVAWVVVVVGLGAFAPRVEHALSGAGWEASGSESVVARDLVQAEFGGQSSNGLMVVLHSEDRVVGSPAFAAAIARSTAILRSDERVASIEPPARGFSISEDGRTAIVRAGAAADPTAMVQVADELKGKLTAAGGDGVDVYLTGASAMWSDFNAANRSAMMKSELYSWPITLAILALAFGALVAAGLPLMLTIIGLVASAGSLFIAAQLGEVSIWAMNFALMFALALGIDYALFIVNRFRGAHFGSKLDPIEAVAVTMDTAGKAVLFSGVTVLVSLSAVMLVPSPAFRSMALGIMLSVVFILAASLTLLPATLAKLGPRVDKGALRWVHSGEHRSPAFARWAERLWRRPILFGGSALAILVALTLPIVGLDTGMPSIKVVPPADASRQGYALVQQAFGPGAPGQLQVVGPASDADRAATVLARDPGIARVFPARSSQTGQLALIEAVPKQDPSDEAVGATIDRLRTTLPAGVLVGGAATENHDLEQALADKTVLVIGVVLALGFLLLLIALQAPVIAAVGVLTNLLAVGAAFGVARLIFQDGHGAGLLGFESQGFLDAWGPIFFFAMIFAISMDYTVFLLSSAKEHWERSHDPKDAVVNGLAHSGRVIFAAAAVMIAVFFTFALSGPLPPKEMGVILGIAVLLDAMLIRLVLVPVALRLLGRRAWMLPRWLDRILPDVRFGH
jgi:RND superfamily putative drug exporter